MSSTTGICLQSRSPNYTTNQSLLSSARHRYSEPASIPTPTRKPTLDEAGKERLAKQLSQRPEKSELVDRNILKDDRVAPALQAARERLERSKLEVRFLSIFCASEIANSLICRISLDKRYFRGQRQMSWLRRAFSSVRVAYSFSFEF